MLEILGKFLKFIKLEWLVILGNTNWWGTSRSFLTSKWPGWNSPEGCFCIFSNILIHHYIYQYMCVCVCMLLSFASPRNLYLLLVRMAFIYRTDWWPELVQELRTSSEHRAKLFNGSFIINKRKRIRWLLCAFHIFITFHLERIFLYLLLYTGC